MSGLGVPRALAKNSLELSALLRKYSYKAPRNLLVPWRVAIDTSAPLLRPISAVEVLVVTLYSWTPLGVRRWTLLEAFGTEDSFASMPSMVVFEDMSREPFTWIPVPAAPAERCTTPGSRVRSASGFRPLSGNSLTSACDMTLPTVASLV